jgi:hypothetical protein
MHPPIFFQAADAGISCEFPRRLENTFLDEVRFDVFSHGNQEASNLTAALNGKARAENL